jgi:hypothetical protein
MTKTIMDVRKIGAFLTLGLPFAFGHDQRQSPELRWVDASSLAIEGRGWADTKSFYHQLSRRTEGIVREPVWRLGQDPGGMLVHFVSDTPEMKVRWISRRSRLAMSHIPVSGVSGFDSYVRINGQ